jgi:hypothetical protein
MSFLKTLCLAMLCTGFAAACSTPVPPLPEPAEEALDSLAVRFPEFKNDTLPLTEYFRLIRRITTYDSVSLELRSASGFFSPTDTLLVVCFNTHGQHAAFPVYPNNTRDYWNFPHDPYVDSVEVKTGSTFKRELTEAFHQLQLDTVSWQAVEYIDELFMSVLHCRRVEMCDSTDLLNKGRRYMTRSWARDKWYEPYDSCRLRLRRNWDEIQEVMSGPAANEVYWDVNRQQVYVVTFSDSPGQPPFDVVTYRVSRPGFSRFFIEEGEL